MSHWRVTAVAVTVPGITWRLTIRDGPKVERDRFDDLDAVMRALEAACRAAGPRGAARGIGRAYGPQELVAVRAEVAGPRRARGGVDVRGDGSATAYTGRLRRRPVEARGDESPYAALRRALSGSVSVEP